MHARALVALAAAALVGCATGPAEPEVFTAAAQTYRAKGSDRLSSVTGQMHRSGDVHRLLVLVDGVSALDGPIGTGDADVSGQYQGKPTQALCSRKDNYRTDYVRFTPFTYVESYEVTCRVIIDGEFVSTLSF